MKYTVEKSLYEFKAWSGGKTRLDELKQHPAAFDAIEDLLEQMTQEREMTETDINDYLWFELDDELEELGYYDTQDGKWYDDGSFNRDED